MHHHDILIVGAGIVGLTTALALTKNSNLQVALVDSQLPPTWCKDKYDSRVSAISLAAKNIFKALGVWETIAGKRVSPYKKMHVWDENSSAALNFVCQQLNESVLGYIIEDAVMRTSLIEALAKQNNFYFYSQQTPVALVEEANQIIINTNTEMFTAKCLIAADGANSWVREQSRIEMDTLDYNQTAIIASVQTSQTHQQTAWQRFLKTGPLAFLPLVESNCSSIVWSTTPEHAEELLKLNDGDFSVTLTAAFANKLGTITAVGPRQSFPLRMRHAKNYVKSRIALVGDAAHTIHPLAGQGLNLGLLDSACLAQVICDAQKKHRDFFSLSTLRRYERWRKGDNLSMLTLVGALKNIFCSEKKSLQTLRSIGMNVTNHWSLVKNYLANQALGNKKDLPFLAVKGIEDV